MMLSLNINSDLSIDRFKEAARLAETAGYSRIWVGENIDFGHSFPLLALAAEITRRIRIGAGILSPQLNRCHHILRAFQTLREVYGDRFSVALAPGDVHEVASAGAAVAKPVQRVLECVAKMRKWRDERRWHLPIYVGASGPRLIAEGSALADGVLLNYVNPEYLRWATRHLKQQTFLAAYGPALLLPDPSNELLLEGIVSVVLAGANKTFLKDFGLTEQARLAGETTAGTPSRARMDFHLEKWALVGNKMEMKKILGMLSCLEVDEVILATPLCRNLASVKTIADVYLSGSLGDSCL